jgi:hypothetical protein
MKADNALKGLMCDIKMKIASEEYMICNCLSRSFDLRCLSQHCLLKLFF